MKEYITSILYMTIVASLVHQILPSERYRKLIGIVCGFLLLLVFFHPFLTGSLQQELQNRYEALADSFQDSYAFDETSREQLLSESRRTEIEMLLREITREDTLTVRIWGHIREDEYQISKVQIKGIKEQGQYEQLILETIKTLYGEEVMVTYW